MWDAEQTYTIQVRAKDSYNLRSEWANLKVIMPHSHSLYRTFYQFLIEHEGLRELIDLFFSILKL
jgi:hypothetical protein